MCKGGLGQSATGHAVKVFGQSESGQSGMTQIVKQKGVRQLPPKLIHSHDSSTELPLPNS